MIEKIWITIVALFFFGLGLARLADVDENNKLKYECEKNLPRTQHCVVIKKAIVKGED